MSPFFFIFLKHVRVFRLSYLFVFSRPIKCYIIVVAAPLRVSGIRLNKTINFGVILVYCCCCCVLSTAGRSTFAVFILPGKSRIPKKNASTAKGR